jgi:hypothetical protein
VAVVDGVECKLYGKIKPPVFSADSRHMANQALLGEDNLLVVDGVEFKGYSAFVGKPRLTFDSSTTLHVLTARGRRFIRVEITIKP